MEGGLWLFFFTVSEGAFATRVCSLEIVAEIMIVIAVYDCLGVVLVSVVCLAAYKLGSQRGDCSYENVKQYSVTCEP